MAEGYLDATEGGATNGLLGEVDDLGGILDLDFITNIPGVTESSTTVSDENPNQYLDKLNSLARKGLTWGATAGLYSVNPLLAIAAHTPPSIAKLGAKKFGQKFLGLPQDTPWGELDQAGKIAVAQEKFGLMEIFYGPTPLSKFVNRFVDIVFPGNTTQNGN